MFSLAEENQFKLTDGVQAIYFYANWMPFLQKMNIMISKVEDKYQQISFIGVDVDNFKSLTKRFKVESVPTTVILINGEEQKRIVGVTMTSAFKSAFVDIFKNQK